MKKVDVYWREVSQKFYMRVNDTTTGERGKPRDCASEEVIHNSEAGYRAAIDEALAWKRELAASSNTPNEGTEWTVFVKAWLEHGTSHMRPSSIK